MKKPGATALLPAIAASCALLLASAARGTPTANISNPTSGTLSNLTATTPGATIVTVTGTATATNPGLQYWILDYCLGSNCLNYTQLTQVYTPVTNGTLFNWDTLWLLYTGTYGDGTHAMSDFLSGQALFLANGPCTLRLRVWDTSNNVATYTVQLQLQNFSVRENVVEFNGLANATVTYTSTVPALSGTLTESLVIKTPPPASAQVRSLSTHQCTGGNGCSYQDPWDGKDDAGHLLPDGPYLYVATLMDSAGHSMTWDLRASGFFFYNSYAEIVRRTVPSDAFNNAPLTYTYSFYTGQPAQTWLIFGPGPSPPTKGSCASGQYCVLGGVFQSSGSHTVQWAYVDGMGRYLGSANGSQQALRHFVLYGTQNTFALNMTILYGGAPSIGSSSNIGVTVTPPVRNVGVGSQTLAVDLEMPLDSDRASLTITIQNQASGSIPSSILKSFSFSNLSRGTITQAWDGRSDNGMPGMPVAPGVYIVTATATGPRGDVATGQVLTTVQY